jgi:transcription elongation GreA/GreB family factor
MSRAFVKESDAVEDLPDRLLSPHANLVTASGLAQIDHEVERLSRVYAEAQAAADRDALAAAARDLRYWSARRASAQLIAPVSEPHDVRFGTTVVLQRDDGTQQTYRIVGEDEADPRQGSLSWVSPLARALSGKTVGDEVRAGNAQFEILAIR